MKCQEPGNESQVLCAIRQNVAPLGSWHFLQNGFFPFRGAMGSLSRSGVGWPICGWRFASGTKRERQTAHRHGRRASVIATANQPTPHMPSVRIVAAKCQRCAAVFLVNSRSHWQRSQKRVSKALMGDDLWIDDFAATSCFQNGISRGNEYANIGKLPVRKAAPEICVSLLL